MSSSIRQSGSQTSTRSGGGTPGTDTRPSSCSPPPSIAAIAATERRRPRGPGLIVLTVTEIRHLFAKLITTVVRPAGFHLAWSRWRRIHQARAVRKCAVTSRPATSGARCSTSSTTRTIPVELPAAFSDVASERLNVASPQAVGDRCSEFQRTVTRRTTFWLGADPRMRSRVCECRAGPQRDAVTSVRSAMPNRCVRDRRSCESAAMSHTAGSGQMVQIRTRSTTTPSIAGRPAVIRIPAAAKGDSVIR
jgi:hypothetical protein